MQNTKVAIIISTMDRPDFLIRTLNYYAKMHSDHPVYIGDSSNIKNAEIIKRHINSIKDRLEIYYEWYPPGFDNLDKNLKRIREKYAVVNGDDDYQIPASLTKCAEFLEDNQNYSSASGYGITFRLKSSGPYGEIQRLANYPMYSLGADTAAQRMLDFMKKNFTITFGVNRVDVLRQISVGKITMISTWNELEEVCYCAIAGKSKLIDCLGFVRQIHDRQYYASAIIDWITSENFYNSYNTFKKHIAQKISEMDDIELEKAESVVKDAFWSYLQRYMESEQKGQKKKAKPIAKVKLAKAYIGKAFPILKTLYHRRFSDQKNIHYDVLDPRTQYNKDFQPVMDSFSGKDN